MFSLCGKRGVIQYQNMSFGDENSFQIHRTLSKFTGTHKSQRRLFYKFPFWYYVHSKSITYICIWNFLHFVMMSKFHIGPLCLIPLCCIRLHVIPLGRFFNLAPKNLTQICSVLLFAEPSTLLCFVLEPSSSSPEMSHLALFSNLSQVSWHRCCGTRLRIFGWN